MGADIAPDDLSTREVISDPYPAYHQLRDRSPFNYQDLPAGSIPGIEHSLRSWALMKYVDVYSALRDHETFSSANNPLVGKAFPPLVLIMDDPPRHTRFRRLVNKAFTLKRVESLEPWITTIAHELLDNIGSGETEVVQSYTTPLPVQIIARLMGIPGEDQATFKRWSDTFISSLVSISL